MNVFYIFYSVLIVSTMANAIVEDEKSYLSSQFSPETLEHLKLIDSWSFDVFSFTNTVNNRPLQAVTHHLFDRYGIIEKFSIDATVLKNFLNKIESEYNRFNNSYHNNMHAADVTQTMNSIIRQTNLNTWLTDLEIFACLFAAIIHDYEHTGTSNGFHVMTKSDRALIYNDRSVQENHHLSAAFFVLQQDDCNILKGLTQDEYRHFRSFVIDLVLSTDMAFHFQILKDVKSRLNLSGLKMEKSKALAFILHACDISNPAKNWNLHSQWTPLLMEEFFKQGDRERELNLQISPLCDRYETLVPESQINFIDFIVDPTFKILGELLSYISNSMREEHIAEGDISPTFEKKPWIECISENRKKWQEKTHKGLLI